MSGREQCKSAPHLVILHHRACCLSAVRHTVILSCGLATPHFKRTWTSSDCLAVAHPMRSAQFGCAWPLHEWSHHCTPQAFEVAWSLVVLFVPICFAFCRDT